jgi:hypothetical protein
MAKKENIEDIEFNEPQKLITANDYIDTLDCSKIRRDILKRQYSYLTEVKEISYWNKIIK